MYRYLRHSITAHGDADQNHVFDFVWRWMRPPDALSCRVAVMVPFFSFSGSMDSRFSGVDCRELNRPA